MFKNLDQVIDNFKTCDFLCCSETWLKPEIHNSLVFFPGKKLFRLDRKNVNGKIRGGGVCIYVLDKLAPFTVVNTECSYTCKDFEILTINVSRPNMRYSHVSCIYKPPTGKNSECIDFIKKIYRGTRREVWILGDFNVDFLDRTCPNRLKYINAFKTVDVRQLIAKYTRPNSRGGTCIDWIVTNSDFVMLTGTLDIFISDHLPVFCIRKKIRETHKYVYRTLRDFTNYNPDNFSRLLRSQNWVRFNTLHDPDEMWKIIYAYIYEILAVMCPFRKFKQREKVTPWMTPVIYRQMRLRDKYISLFRVTGYQNYLVLARKARNNVNNMVTRAKSFL